MRFKYFLLLTGLALLLGPAAGMGQFGPPGGGGFNGRGFPGGGPRQQGGFQGGGPSQGGWSGRGARQNGNFPGGPGQQNTFPGAGAPQQGGFPGGGMGQGNRNRGFPGGGGFPGRAPGGGPTPGGPGGGFNPDTFAEWRFHQMDVNGDGVLNYDEMDDALKAERDKWDTNKDGFIDLAEYKEYFKARMQAFQEAAAQAGPRPDSPFPEEKKATVYRAGKLPPNLPAWFAQYDTDQDGQIGLYEWKAAGQPIAQFLEMDRNGDGFLTPDEVLRAVGAKHGETSAPVAMGNSPGANGRPGMGPGFGRGPGGNGRGFPGGRQGQGNGRRGFPAGGPGGGFPGGQ
jgi:hypothetical protein